MSPEPFVPALNLLPRRILMTADTVGGVWTYALELARCLGEQEIEVALATMGEPLSSAHWRQAERITNLTVFESRYKLEWMENPWADVEEAGHWLLSIEQQLRPEVVHLNNYSHAALPWSAPTVVVAHSCVLSWWTAVKGEAAPSGWDRYRDAVTAGLREADAVVAPTRAMLREIQRLYGPPARGEVIANGREVAFSRGPKEPLIFSAGRLWDEAKNVETLARAARGVAWPVHVAGDCQEPNGKSVQFENVRALGRLSGDDMARWLERAAIYCLPARYEPFGLSALEAALAGCALVLGDIPSLREIWQDAARFVAPHDEAALREALLELSGDANRRRDYAGRAHERALEFTSTRMSAAYLALYSELIRDTEPRNELLICES